MNNMIRQESAVSLFVLGAVIMGIFGAYTTFEPNFRQIEVNASEIRSNQKTLDELKTTQKAIFKQLIEVSQSLARIEGHLDATRPK